ncbi:hypothetical protein [Demequina litorisediminis]|uniref:hypothetical protein n=1 Tax=Demequina litorisediminis TaxID=1849022 RepID=UPI0024E172C0|nr:hypothetical protein [Demequina litorisediminis]
MTVEATRTLSTQDELLWRRFSAMLTTVPAALDERLRALTGLNHFQFTILSTLDAHPDGTLQARRGGEGRRLVAVAPVPHHQQALRRKDWWRAKRASTTVAPTGPC